ncbi:MAG: PTS sugar transporter subunit IIB [Deltaproteobacteria bacterium]|uniref:PTS sugar transporter subunit IIB n=1 Tax=Candidatus Zymogenus saltonus TaxID=2844893 RepID=A0A9D8KIH4_9DELT|nr:PTS sugar transporter subunit IIB [Candidatus Zymogenus saltonus]
MGIVLIRVDSRLIHGQILEAWIPFTEAESIVVVDNEVAENLQRRTIMEMAIPSKINVEFDTVDEAVKDFLEGRFEEKRTLILFSNVQDVMEAFDKGFVFDSLNLGNMHFCKGKVQVSSNLCMGNLDCECILRLNEKGVSIDSRSVPNERTLEVDKLLSIAAG